MSMISTPLLSGASTLDASQGVDLLNKGPENAIYINWGTGVTAGAIAIETAASVGYTGAWAPYVTVAFTGTAPRVDCVQITGAFRTLRTRISQAVVGGTVSTEISTNE